VTPRSEPLLWLQLIALGAIPLELLGLLLLLAGADPGPLPGLERVLAWAIGALGPAILLWKRPADVCSLLLVQVPIRGRSEAQRSLSALQSPVPLKLAMVGGAAALLPLFWWMDQHAALAASLSPLAASPRLVGLLLACPLLALMVWQWQQLTQALGLLRTSPETLEAVTPLTASQLDSQRLNLGLPLLLLGPLQIPERASIRPEFEPKPEPADPKRQPAPAAEPVAEQEAQPEPESLAEPVAEPEAQPEPDAGLDLELEPTPISPQEPEPAEEPAEQPRAELQEELEGELEEEPSLTESPALPSPSISSDASVADAVAIQPEETAEQPESTELDQEIP
jgi:hypothetical protein